MSNQMAQLQEATIKAHCKSLRMPMIATQFGSMAEQAIREKKSHIGYLSITVGRDRRKGAQHHRAANQGSPPASSKDTGRVRLYAISERHSGENA